MRDGAILLIHDPAGVKSFEWGISKPGGRSLVYICHQCGEVYAKLRTWHDGLLLPFYPAMGTCHSCPGNRWTIPGSLEHLHFANWSKLPLEVLEYQLEREILFLSHPDHPHNKDIPQ